MMLSKFRKLPHTIGRGFKFLRIVLFVDDFRDRRQASPLIALRESSRLFFQLLVLTERLLFPGFVDGAGWRRFFLGGGRGVRKSYPLTFVLVGVDHVSGIVRHRPFSGRTFGARFAERAPMAFWRATFRPLTAYF